MLLHLDLDDLLKHNHTSETLAVPPRINEMNLSTEELFIVWGVSENKREKYGDKARWVSDSD